MLLSSEHESMLLKIKVRTEAFALLPKVTKENRRMQELVSKSQNGLHIYFFKDGLKMKSNFHRITKLSHLSSNLLILPHTCSD